MLTDIYLITVIVVLSLIATGAVLASGKIFD